MDKREVEENEESMFRQYIKDIKQEHQSTEMSYFDMNLEVQTKYLYQFLFIQLCLTNYEWMIGKTSVIAFLDLETVMAGFGSVKHCCDYHRCSLSSTFFSFSSSINNDLV